MAHRNAGRGLVALLIAFALVLTGCGPAVLSPSVPVPGAQAPQEPGTSPPAAQQPTADQARATENAGATDTATEPGGEPAGPQTEAAAEEGAAGETASTTWPPAAATSPPATASPQSAAPEVKNTAQLAIHGPVGSGMILAATPVEVEADDTVLSLLKRAARAHRLQMEFRGRGSMAYVEGIDNLYEFDEGPESGWLYRVNGVFPAAGAGMWPVQPGDTVEWLYTRDLGRDVGGYVQDGVSP